MISRENVAEYGKLLTTYQHAVIAVSDIPVDSEQHHQAWDEIIAMAKQLQGMTT
jgi:hypothetical protein